MHRIYLAGLLVPTRIKHGEVHVANNLSYISISSLSPDIQGELGELLIKRLERHGGALSFPVFRLSETALSMPQRTWSQLEKVLRAISPNISQRGAEVWVMWQKMRPIDFPLPGSRAVCLYEELSLEVCVLDPILEHSSVVSPKSSGSTKKPSKPKTQKVENMQLDFTDF